MVCGLWFVAWNHRPDTTDHGPEHNTPQTTDLGRDHYEVSVVKAEHDVTFIEPRVRVRVGVGVRVRVRVRVVVRVSMM